jgi:para-nitrobenzyl esterase
MPMRPVALLATLTVLIATLPLAAETPDYSMQPIAGDPVRTEGGRVAGTKRDGVKAYLGIPFAAPPTGERRWRAPASFAWSGIWPANRNGAACIQVLRPHDINHYFGEEATSEDCLTLNLWTPATARAGSKLPVIVFIYGGGFTIGSSGMANYDGASVARRGAVFVNFNYRVGALGFLAHPEISHEQDGHSGNYGLMDQIAALKWVRANIAKFGGDPARVVIMGQSAGASSVVAHLFSPQSRGLFRGAVMSSGCNIRSEFVALQDAETIGTALAARLGAASIAAMRNMPADRILAAQNETQLGLRTIGVRINGPVTDGFVLPRPKAAGLANGVPVVVGYTANDLAFGFETMLKARTIAEYRAAAKELWREDAPEFMRLNPVTTDSDIAATARRVATEAGFEGSARHCAQMLNKAGMPTWIYDYARVHPYASGIVFADQNPATAGAYHTADIPYWFGTQDAYNRFRPTRVWTAWDRQLSDSMMDALIAFAATGRPVTKGFNWPAWRPGDETKVMFGDTVKTVPLDPARLDWFAAHPFAEGPPAPPPANPRD